MKNFKLLFKAVYRDDSPAGDRAEVFAISVHVKSEDLETALEHARKKFNLVREAWSLDRAGQEG